MYIMRTQGIVALVKLLVGLAAVDGRPNDNELMYIFQLMNKFSIPLEEQLSQLKNMTDTEAVANIKLLDDSTKLRLPFMMYYLINSDGPATPEEIRSFETIMRAIGRPCPYASWHAHLSRINKTTEL